MILSLYVALKLDLFSHLPDRKKVVDPNYKLS